MFSQAESETKDEVGAASCLPSQPSTSTGGLFFAACPGGFGRVRRVAGAHFGRGGQSNFPCRVTFHAIYRPSAETATNFPPRTCQSLAESYSADGNELLNFRSDASHYPVV